MRNIHIYQIDAFASKVFLGNPAAVCPLQEWLDDDIMQAIAAENNLSETAFLVPEDEGYRLRWFTPCEDPARKCHYAATPPLLQPLLSLLNWNRNGIPSASSPTAVN